MIHISIIMPVYNVASYLESAINSILQQDYTDYELILIDDGSTDGSGDICDKYHQKHSNRILVYHTGNKGVSHARNLGIESAHGEYLYFMDSDDELIGTSLLKELSTLLAQSGSKALITFGYSVSKEYQSGQWRENNVLHNQESYSLNNHLGKQQFLSDCLDGYMFVVWNKIFHKSIIIDNNIRFQNVLMEDYRFVLDYINHVDSLCFPNIIGYKYYQRFQSKSLVSAFKNGMEHDYIFLHQKLIQFIDDKRCDTLIHLVFYPQYYSLLNKYIHNYQYNKKQIKLTEIAKITSYDLVQKSFKAHKTTSISETVSKFLISHRLFKTYIIYRRIVALCRK